MEPLSRQAAMLSMVGFLASVVLSIQSDGFYQDDDITHFLLAKAGYGDPMALLHWWARPGYNLLTVLPAHFGGFLACRIWSGVQTALIAFFAFRIAQHVMGTSRWTLWVPVCVWMQPLVFRLSTTTLTETPAALFLTLAVLLFVRGRHYWACLAMSVVFVTRYETLALGPVWALALLMVSIRQEQGKWTRLMFSRRVVLGSLLLLLAPLLYGLVAWLANVPADASPIHIFTRDYTGEYGTGPIDHMLTRWPEACGFSVLVFAIAGVWSLRRNGGLVLALVAAQLVLQSLLFWKGGYASGGYPRFMIPVSGLLAVLAAAGFRCLWSAYSKWVWTAAAVFAAALPLLIAYRFSQYVSWAYVAGPSALFFLFAFLAYRVRPAGNSHPVGRIFSVVLCVAAILQFGFQARVLSLSDEKHHSLLSDALSQLEERRAEGVPVLSQHVLISYLMGDEARMCSGNSAALEAWNAAEEGSWFVWENKYCLKPHEPETTELLRNRLNEGGVSLLRLNRDGAQVEIFVRTARPLN